MIQKLSFFIFILYPLASFSQQWEVEKEIAIANPTEISIDRKGNVFVADKAGRLYKFENGKMTKDFSPGQQMQIDQLEAWQGLKMLTFNENAQTIYLIDRFLANFQSIDLHDIEEIGFASAATLGQNNQLLIYDQTNNSLLFINTVNLQLTNLIPIQGIPQLAQLKIIKINSIGTQIYLYAEGKLIVLDNFGNFIALHELPISGNYQFWGNVIYCISEMKVYQFDLKNKKTLPIDLNTSVTLRAVSRNKDKIVAITDTSLLYFKSID